MHLPCRGFCKTGRRVVAASTFCFGLASVCFSQAPAVFKVEPPSWWTRSTVNPVRLLIHGQNLQGARVEAIDRVLTVKGLPRADQRGTYLVVNVAIADNVRPGEYEFRISTPKGASRAQFEILGPLKQSG